MTMIEDEPLTCASANIEDEPGVCERCEVVAVFEAVFQDFILEIKTICLRRIIGEVICWTVYEQLLSIENRAQGIHTTSTVSMICTSIFFCVFIYTVCKGPCGSSSTYQFMIIEVKDNNGPAWMNPDIASKSVVTNLSFSGIPD
jgi:hypothetical protein